MSFTTKCCSAAEIAEKKRIALEKLRVKKAQQQFSSNKLQQQPSTSATGTSTAVNNSSSTDGKTLPQPATPGGATVLTNAIKQSNIFLHRQEGRDMVHPYKRPGNTEQTKRFGNGPLLGLGHSSNQQQTTTATAPLASVFVQAVTCRVYMMSPMRFAVQPNSYHTQMIEVFKSIPSKAYDQNTRIWNFSLQEYPLLVKRMEALKPNVVMGVIPKAVLRLCSSTVRNGDRSVLTSIASTLANKLMPFQQEGVCKAIAHHGRIMICDEMGLGKTYQALAVADFYRDNWPLLICTTASTRESWASHVRELLPTVPLHNIQVLCNNQQQYIGDAKVLITSYHLMEKMMQVLLERKFGVLIFDESHTLKNSKAKCTTVADRLSMQARQVLLLSGTPALSRPLELFSQLQMIDRKFMSFREFSSRYCDGKQTNFGWDATGQSNLDELNVLLKLKFMIRRTKADVLPELAEKMRETIVLDPSLVWRSEDAKKELSKFTKNWNDSKGRAKEEILLQFYSETAKVKTRAVCAYLRTLIKEKVKFIVFAHHRVMLDAITECLNKLRVNFIRIDGTTKNDTRVELIDMFQTKSSCRVAVLSLKACNAGITLTAAEMIIFAELDWNPSTLAQAESRAHRIGQEKALVCRYLMANKTADDIIWNMLNNKQNVLNQAGLFCEDLHEAKNKNAPTISRKIEHYFSPDNSNCSLTNISFNSSCDETSDTLTALPASTKAKDSNQLQQHKNPALIGLTQELASIEDIFIDDDINAESVTPKNHEQNSNKQLDISKELESVEDFFKDDDDDAFKDLNF